MAVSRVAVYKYSTFTFSFIVCETLTFDNCATCGDFLDGANACYECMDGYILKDEMEADEGDEIAECICKYDRRLFVLGIVVNHHPFS